MPMLGVYKYFMQSYMLDMDDGAASVPNALSEHARRVLVSKTYPFTMILLARKCHSYILHTCMRMCQDMLISMLWEVNPALLIAIITADSAQILNLFGATTDVISQINVGFWRSGAGPDATFATHRCVLDSGAVISAASKSFYNENIKDKPCEMRALQNISGRHLRDASGGQMRVLGVCEVKMHIHRDLASSIKLLRIWQAT